MDIRIKRIQFKRDLLQNWLAHNPVLANGEPAYVTDTGMFKIGDGVTPFMDLAPVSVPSNTMGSITHLNDPDVERPDFITVMWIGSVEPVNAQDNDLWVNI